MIPRIKESVKPVEDLTDKERRFMENYSKGKGLRESCKGVYANSCGKTVLQRPRVQRVLKELIPEGVNAKIVAGIEERLEDPMSRHWQPTADYVAKLRGDFAPDKVVSVNLSPEERNQEYDKVLDLVKRKNEV
jgi:hypothetical protein